MPDTYRKLPTKTEGPDFDALVAALVAAKVAGIAACTGEDGGTCNSDTATLRAHRARQVVIRAAAEKAGVRMTKLEFGLWRGCYWISEPCGSGQGDRRTRVAEAMEKALKDAGYDATVYYAID